MSRSVILPIFFIVAVFSAIAFSGCINVVDDTQVDRSANGFGQRGEPPAGGPGGTGGQGGQFPFQGRGGQNMTDEQRQQFFNERLQVAMAACQNKTSGDTCIVQSPRGGLNGTCSTQDGILSCQVSFIANH
ncbi:MAG: hypothetical protein V1644_03635 [Candidatus Micrarchaeota archaeon]